MFLTSPPQTRASREAAQVWRAAAQLVWVRWQTFLDAGTETRRLKFASYVAALDAEEAAAADMAALAAMEREVVHLRLRGSAMRGDPQAVETPERFNASPRGSTSSNIVSPTSSERGSWIDSSLGARGHNPRGTSRAQASPTQPQFDPDNPGPPTPGEGPLHE
jgi:hypothetical protein